MNEGPLDRVLARYVGDPVARRVVRQAAAVAGAFVREQLDHRRATCTHPHARVVYADEDARVWLCLDCLRLHRGP